MRGLAMAAVLVGLAIGPASAGWFSDEVPPPDGMKLSEIIAMIEGQGLTPITEVEFEGGTWKIEVHQADGREIDLAVDPKTGRIIMRK